MVYKITEDEYDFRPLPVNIEFGNFKKYEAFVKMATINQDFKQLSSEKIVIYGNFNNGTLMVMKVSGSKIQLGTSDGTNFEPTPEFENFTLFTNYLVNCFPLICVNSLMDSLVFHADKGQGVFTLTHRNWTISVERNFVPIFGEKDYEAAFYNGTKDKDYYIKVAI